MQIPFEFRVRKRPFRGRRSIRKRIGAVGGAKLRGGINRGEVIFIEGNPHVPGIEGSLCPRGSASIAQLYDSERVQSPMIRVGERGAGQWRKASWDEALDYVAGKLKPIIKKHGGHSVVLGERTQLATHVSQTFLKAIGSPNHFTHDAICKASVNTACRSLFGYPDTALGIDYKNTRHIVLYGRNLFESIQVKASEAS